MIKPYHKGNYKHIESLIAIAACSWNMTTVPQEEAKKMHEAMLNIYQDDIEQKQVLEALIVKFIEIKLEKYSEDNRFIVSYQFDTTCEPPHLNIGSVPFGDDRLQSSNNKLKAGRNGTCPCGSGKKYKKRVMFSNYAELANELLDNKKISFGKFEQIMLDGGYESSLFGSDDNDNEEVSML